MGESGVGRMFLKMTRYERRRGGPRHGSGAPGAASGRIDLAAPTAPGQAADLWRCLRERRSVRGYRRDSLSLEDVGRLAWACAGLNGRAEAGFRFRTWPSAGALYPIDTYVCCRDVDGVPPGSYRYDEEAHALEPRRRGDLSAEIAAACLGQSMAAEAPAVFVFTAVSARSTGKYSDRGYRYVCMEAGIVSAHLYLAATSLGLGSCAIGAFVDEQLEAVVGADGSSEVALLAHCVGPAGTTA